MTVEFCLNMFLESILVRRASVEQRKLLMLLQHDHFHPMMINNPSERGWKFSCFNQAVIALFLTMDRNCLLNL